MESEDSRFLNYRANSVSSTDSFDGIAKMGRSISIGSDGGYTDTDFDKLNQRSPSARSMSVGSFQGEMMMLKLSSSTNSVSGLSAKQETRPPGKNSSGAPKKRSRDVVSVPKATTAESRAPAGGVVEPPIKSPKRSYHKQQSNSVKNSVQRGCANGSLVEDRYRGSYLDLPFGSSFGALHHESGPMQFKQYGSVMHAAGDDLDMVSMLDKIDWSDDPQHLQSPSSSPFTDSAASLSSSSETAAPGSSHPISHCGGSPLSFSLHSGATAESSSDGLEALDDYCREMLCDPGLFQTQQPLSAVPHPINRNNTAVAAFVSSVVQQQQSAAAARDIKEVNRLYNVPLAALPKKETPPQNSSRVWFSSHVIDELKKKTVHSASASNSIRHGFLRPVPDPLAPLPPLHTLKADAPPVVLSSQSLTLYDSTFCNYPLLLQSDSESLPEVGASSSPRFNLLQEGALLGGQRAPLAPDGRSRAMSENQVAPRPGLAEGAAHLPNQAGLAEGAAHLPNQVHGGLSLQVPRAHSSLSLAASPAKKRGRPKKGVTVSQPCSPVVSSKGVDNVGGGGQFNGSCFSDNSFQLRQQSHQNLYQLPVQPPKVIASHPSFPHMSALGDRSSQESQQEFEDFLLQYAENDSCFVYNGARPALPSAQFVNPFRDDGPCVQTFEEGEDGLGGDSSEGGAFRSEAHTESAAAAAVDELLYDDLLGCVFE